MPKGKIIDSVANRTWFNGRDWLVVGTGDSLKRWQPKYIDMFNVWTINAAIDVTRYADIAAFHDTEIFCHKDKYIKNKYDARHELTRTKNHHSGKETTLYVQFPNDPKIFPAEHNTSCSSGFAFQFLCPKFKRIYTLGIDGGKGVSNLLHPFYQSQESGQNFDDHHQSMDYHVSVNNTQIVKL
jgi:hypothetical protein